MNFFRFNIFIELIFDNRGLKKAIQVLAFAYPNIPIYR